MFDIHPDTLPSPYSWNRPH